MINALRCVVDASVGIKQFIPDPLTPKAKKLFAYLRLAETEFFVPDLFYIESVNILWKYIRAGLYDVADLPEDLANMKGYPLQVTSTADLMTEAITIAVTYGITAYNAAYVALSDRVKTPLLTLDRKLFNTLISSPYDVQWFVDFPLL